MRFATLETDSWELESGEERHAKSPKQFWLPAKEARSSLRAGQLAKLLFLIEAIDENGNAEHGVERMWVLVTEVHSQYLLGRLVNQPVTIAEDADVYLSLGSEIPFRSEHVIDIHEWAREDVEDFLANAPFKPWYGATT